MESILQITRALFCNFPDVCLFHNVHFRKSQVKESSGIQYKGRFPCFLVLCIIMHVAGPLYILTDENNDD